jgi:hypothetical protein
MPFLWSVDDPKITARPMRGLDKSAKTKKKKKKKKKKKQSKARQIEPCRLRRLAHLSLDDRGIPFGGERGCIRELVEGVERNCGYEATDGWGKSDSASDLMDIRMTACNSTLSLVIAAWWRACFLQYCIHWVGYGAEHIWNASSQQEVAENAWIMVVSSRSNHPFIQSCANHPQCIRTATPPVSTNSCNRRTTIRTEPEHSAAIQLNQEH